MILKKLKYFLNNLYKKGFLGEQKLTECFKQLKDDNL